MRKALRTPRATKPTYLDGVVPSAEYRVSLLVRALELWSAIQSEGWSDDGVNRDSLPGCFFPPTFASLSVPGR
jgi:hypothetical protein